MFFAPFLQPARELSLSLNAAMKARHDLCNSMRKRFIYINRTSFGPHPPGEPPHAASKAGEDRIVFPMCSLSYGTRNCLKPEGCQPLAVG